MNTEAAIITDADVKATNFIETMSNFFKKYEIALTCAVLSIVSAITFVLYMQNGLGIAYNDARSHLDIGRRVVEGLNPGLAQLGSVWLPLIHFLMIFTVWNDFMWHTGLAGAIISMICYVATGITINLTLKRLSVPALGRLVGVAVFATNTNILYLQSTAMTELLLLFTLTAACYELISYFNEEKIWTLIKASFWIMLATLTRYEGWFLFLVAAGLVTYQAYKKKGYKAAEGIFILMSTLGGFGIFLWIVWNLAIFGDPLYFAFGPYSAHAQQTQVYEAGGLYTRGNLLFSAKTYFYTMMFSTNAFVIFTAFAGAIVFAIDKTYKTFTKAAILALLISPLAFNVLALYMGHSIIVLQGVTGGGNWFNVRYGVMMLPSFAILIGYLIYKAPATKVFLIAMLAVALTYTYTTITPVTIADAKWGASSKNVSQVADWLKVNAKDNEDKILIAAGSHDAIIFTSGYQMSRFIHEGTGRYWEEASENPQLYARYIILRTYDTSDLTFKVVGTEDLFAKYDLKLHGEFADIYELKSEYVAGLRKIDDEEFAKVRKADRKRQEEKGVLLLGKQTTSTRGNQLNTFATTIMFVMVAGTLLAAKFAKRTPKKVQPAVEISPSEFVLNLRSKRNSRKKDLTS